MPEGFSRRPASPRVERAWDRMREIVAAAKAHEEEDHQAQEITGLIAADRAMDQAFASVSAYALRMRVERATTPAGLSVKAAMIASLHAEMDELRQARDGYDPNNRSPFPDLCSLLLDLIEAGERGGASAGEGV